MKCDRCGRFTITLRDVFSVGPIPDIDLEVCPDCFDLLTRKDQP